MSDYDFKSLNDKEFEIFVADVLGDLHGVRYERFKPGRDAGVDGRYFASKGKEIVLQCKHWANTPIDQLIRALGNDERKKVERLKPARYILAVSNPLSRADKNSIYKALSPFIKNESDIFGKEDLNDLVKKRPEIERRHYKLWLYSANVISHILNKPIFERSAFSLEEALSFARKYVRTSSHEKALEKLEKLRVVIISGEAGVGKTTLAEHLCLEYVVAGYHLFQISEGTHEAEGVFEGNEKQIFYFDDFLGRNYLEALTGHEGSKIVNFIRRINKTKNKRFILTSRSTILNQGKVFIDNFRNENLDRNEFELSVATLSEIDKARILYNHIWHSELSVELIDELYKGKRYRQIIKHQNFNPRLISFITDAKRCENLSAEQYWPYIESALTNPADVWESPFDAQQDDYGRAIVLLTTLSGKPINETDLAESYSHFVARPENAGLKGHRDFLLNLRHLSGSLLSRRITKTKTGTAAEIDLFNPSLGDYVLRRYAHDLPTIKAAFLSLRSNSSLASLRSLKEDEIISTGAHFEIVWQILNEATSIHFAGYKLEYVATAANDLIKMHPTSFDICRLQPVVEFVVSEQLPRKYERVITLAHWGFSAGFVSTSKAKELIDNAWAINGDESELIALGKFAAKLKEKLGDTATETIENVKRQIIEYVTDTLSDEVYDHDAFSCVDYGDYQKAERVVRELINEWLSKFGIEIDGSVADEILENYDVVYGLDKFYENSGDNYDYRESAPMSVSDDIDDLFDRT